ncbi:MAG: hypothetical protein ABIK59_04195 [candidate division WOR-3 bacterium]
MNLCALLEINKDKGKITNRDNVEIRRIQISQEVQNAIREYIRSQVDFYIQAEKIEFSGEYKPDEEKEVLCIHNFEFPYTILPPLSMDTIKEDEIEKIFAIFFIHDEEEYIACQSFDNRKIIKPEKMFLLYSKNTFSKIDKKGLIIDSKIDALFLIKEKILLFRSYQNASKIFDLKEIYREATDQEVEKFYKDEIFVGTESLEPSHFNNRLRKKIFLIQKNNILSLIKSKFDIIYDYAENLGMEKFFDKSKRKINFPRENKEIEKLLNFLNEDLFKSGISNCIYLTNSKRKIE